jgi:predicted permease
MREGWKRVFRIGGVERDIEEELAFHRERTIEELVGTGLSRGEAEAEARRRFGDEARWRRELERTDRSVRSRRRIRESVRVVADMLGKAIRGIGRHPGLAAGVVLTFALGVGANATMFAVLDRLLLSPPAHIEEPVSVKRVMVDRYNSFVGERRVTDHFSYPDYADFRGSVEAAQVAAYGYRAVVIGRGPDAFEAVGELATGDYFRLLGVQPARGRFFTPAEDTRGGARVAVLSHGFWQRHFGGAEVLGRTLELGEGAYTVIGVAPEGFTGVDLEAVDVWLPLHVAAYPGHEVWAENRFWYWINLVGRLSPGSSEAQAEAELTVAHLQGRRAQIDAEEYDAEADVLLTPLMAAGGPLASDASRVAKWLGGLSVLVLLIATFNVANLLLARASERRREVAVRLALGISRRRLAGEMLVEGLVLSMMGAAAALAVGGLAGRVLQRLLLPDLVWPELITPRLVGFTVAVAVGAGIAALALPMLKAVRQQVGEALRSARSAGGGSRIRSGLTAVQAALSVVLLVAAGLFIQSLQRAERLDLGFDPQGLYLVDGKGADELEGPGRARLYRVAADRLGRLPGVASTAVLAASRPLSGTNLTEIRVPGRDSLPELAGNTPAVHAVDEDYLTTLGLELHAGRWIRSDDDAGSSPVVVVNRALADLVLGPAPLDACFYLSADGPCLQVVGVVATAKQASPSERARPQLYIPFRQQDRYPANSVLVRVRPGAEGVVSAIRSAFLEASPASIRYIDVRSLADRLVPFLRPWRLGANVFTAFGILALLVAGIGLYSLLAYEVTRRRPELGIRGALGASRRRIVRSVVGRSLATVGAGIAIGLGLTALIAPRAADLLYETSPWDPVTLVAVPLILLLVALAATALPAHRASRVHPAEALRAE